MHQVQIKYERVAPIRGPRGRSPVGWIGGRTRAVASWALFVTASALAGPASFGPVELTTDARFDSVTVGQRFHVAYRFSFPDSLTQLIPERLDEGTCRVVSIAWTEQPADHRIDRTADVTFIPVSLDSSVIPPNRFAFVAPAGDTVYAVSDTVEVPIRRIALDAKDTRPLKEQWNLPPNYLLWALAGLGVLALAAGIVWWVRRRRARRTATTAPEVRLPPDIVALTELERIAGMGYVDRGEFKLYYTLVVDVVRRYLEARFGVEAMDRTSSELIREIQRHGAPVGDLGALLEEADLVKFAKLVPDRPAAAAAIERARAIVVDTTPRVETPAVAAGAGA